MEAFQITPYSSRNNYFYQNEFEDAVYHSARSYSMQHLIVAGITSQEDILKALQRAMKVCSLAGIDARLHFEKIFVYDVNNETIYTDWLMTKKGFNLILIQYPLLNEKIARWLLEITAGR